MRIMQLDGQSLSLSEIAAVALGDLPIKVAPSAHGRIQDARKVVEFFKTFRLMLLYRRCEGRGGVFGAIFENVEPRGSVPLLSFAFQIQQNPPRGG